MGPGLWLSSLPLHGSEVPERHLSDWNWEDGEMKSEKNVGREEMRKQDRGGGGGVGAAHVGADTMLLF